MLLSRVKVPTPTLSEPSETERHRRSLRAVCGAHKCGFTDNRAHRSYGKRMNKISVPISLVSAVCAVTLLPSAAFAATKVPVGKVGGTCSRSGLAGKTAKGSGLLCKKTGSKLKWALAPKKATDTTVPSKAKSADTTVPSKVKSADTTVPKVKTSDTTVPKKA
jgi:hypothetical protein